MQPTGITTIVGRRALLEGAGIGVLGLASAALLGCSNSGPETGGTGQPSAAAPITAATGVETLPLTAPVAQGRPRKGGTFTWGTAGTTYTEHDSHTQRGASEWHPISEKLLDCGPIDAKTLPAVATSWEVADPKGLTLVFKIKPGLKIHNVPPWNGREFDAQDVAWNLERIGGLYAERLKIPLSSFQRASMVQNIVKAEAIDRSTVKVTLSAPNSGFFAGVSENRTMLMPKEMDDIGYNDPMKFGGIGPFQMAEFKKDQNIRFKRFDGYFRPNEPSFDEEVIQAIPDRAATIAAFISGQTQFVSGVLTDEAETVKRGKPDALLYSWIDSNWNHIRPSMSYKPFQDLRVRKAIHLSLDYAALGNAVYGSGWGYQVALDPGFPEAWKPSKVRSLPGYNPDTKAQDRAEAGKLLAAAGYTGGKGIEFDILFTNTGNIWIENATRLQGQLTSLYPDMKIGLTPVDSGNFSTRQAGNKFQALSYVITAVPDAVLEMISQYHSTGSRNYGQFSDPNLDALLDKALGELNGQARTQLLNEFQQRYVDDWRPMWVLHANAARHMLQSNIGGFDQWAGTWSGYSFSPGGSKFGRLTYLDK